MNQFHDIQAWASHYQNQSPQAILRFAAEQFETIGIAFSGAEDVVLIEMLSSLKLSNVQVFCLDTGRLHPETYRFLETVRTRYGVSIELLFPNTDKVEFFVKNKGLLSFYEDGHQECCQIRKVEPLERKLRQLSAWITGQRRDQSPDTRAAVPVVEWDNRFNLVKFNPLANWTSTQVWEYIESLDVPFNPLHQKGFVSIGCEPCTRPILPHEHERTGRWWWESGSKKECGLHAINVPVARQSNFTPFFKE
jgi:phosphoadenosine phosphosulfate reductase